MSRFAQLLVPTTQRQTSSDMARLLDLDSGDRVGKRSGFLIMLILSGIIAVSGVIGDSTATVIGAMIIAPLGTPILGMAYAIVTGDRLLLLRSFGWVALGVVLVVLTGSLLSAVVLDPSALNDNAQIEGRTSPQVQELLAALATGTAGAFAMCRKDLGAVLPGVAIAISLVPPLGVVGVTAGQGQWEHALGAFLLFLSNVVSLVIAGSVVFTLAGYSAEARVGTLASKRRAYIVVGVLTVVIVIPLAVNSAITILLAQWGNQIQAVTVDWLDDADDGGRVSGVTWSGLTATVEVATPDGTTPTISDLTASLEGTVPSGVSVVLDVSVGNEHQVR